MGQLSDGHRLPPQDIEAEMSVLGAMFLGDQGAIEKATEIVSKHDFYKDTHKLIFSAMKYLYDRDEPVDIVSLKDALESKGSLDAAGGISYLMTIGDFVPTSANVKHYATIVKNRSRARQVIEIAGHLAGLAYSGQTDGNDKPFDTILLDAIAPLLDGKTKGGTLLPVEDIFPALLEQWEQNALGQGGDRLGIKSELKPLDWYLKGFRPGKLIVIAARPSMGKTTLAFNIANGFALNNKTSYFYTQEMSAEEVTTAMLSSISGVMSERMEEGILTDEEQVEIHRAMDVLYGKVIFRDHTVSPVRIREDLRRAKVKPSAVFVDYIQLMEADGVSDHERENVKLSKNGKDLKEIAKEFGIPVIVLAQLNKQNESRDDKRPVLSDIGGSDAISAHADTVIGLYRVSYYERKEQINESNMDDPFKRDETELIILKNRGGRTGTVLLDMVPGYSRFVTQRPNGL